MSYPYEYDSFCLHQQVSAAIPATINCYTVLLSCFLDLAWMLQAHLSVESSYFKQVTSRSTYKLLESQTVN